MKGKKFSEEVIFKILKEYESGIPAKELGRKYGMAEQTVHKWKKKYHGMQVSDAKKLRSLEEENRRLKRLVADLSLDNQIHFLGRIPVKFTKVTEYSRKYKVAKF
ncbi:MAG: transposase [Halobacteriovoraceae bacterium]|nr:transposase [Halobacteriovoraceae bacterium]